MFKGDKGDEAVGAPLAVVPFPKGVELAALQLGGVVRKYLAGKAGEQKRVILLYTGIVGSHSVPHGHVSTEPRQTCKGWAGSEPARAVGIR